MINQKRGLKNYKNLALSFWILFFLLISINISNSDNTNISNGFIFEGEP